MIPPNTSIIMFELTNYLICFFIFIYNDFKFIKWRIERLIEF